MVAKYVPTVEVISCDQHSGACPVSTHHFHSILYCGALSVACAGCCRLRNPLLSLQLLLWTLSSQVTPSPHGRTLASTVLEGLPVDASWFLKLSPYLFASLLTLPSTN